VTTSSHRPTVFISWSRPSGLSYAEFMKDVLEALFHEKIHVFVSTNVGKGKSFWVELKRNLRLARFGVVVVTPDSILSPWLHFETGAMLNCECAPLLFGVAPEELPGTLKNIQATEFNIDDVERLVLHINRKIGSPYRPVTLRRKLNELWPVIEDCYAGVSNIATELAGMAQERTLRELMFELLTRVDKLQVKLLGSEYEPNWPMSSNVKRTALPYTIVAGASSDNPILALNTDNGHITIEMGTTAGRKEFARLMRRDILKPLRNTVKRGA